MAKDQEEIAEDERDEEDARDDEDTDEGDESDEDEDSDEDADEDDDSDDEDSDDDSALPKTQKELNKLIAAGVKAALNRSSAARRTSKDGKTLPENKKRPVSDSRVDELAASVAEVKAAEAKRQFGYENDLAPDEVDVVFRLSKKPSAKTLRDPIVKGALEGYRTAKRARNNTPRGGDRTIRITGKDHKNLPPAERKNNFVARRQQALEQSRRGR